MPNDPVLRDAANDEVSTIHALVERAYRGEHARHGWTHEADLLDGARTSADEIAAILADATQRLLVLEDDGTIVGCVNVADVGDGTAYLGMLTVEPMRQACGYGRMLLAAAERSAVATFGSSRIEMTVVSQRSELVAYYERRGYRLTGERRPFVVVLDPPLEFVVLEKRL
jgi:N-acetylglutamate synthase-like GNAT family acetyltransferase